jgi:hypothetical protein
MNIKTIAYSIIGFALGQANIDLLTDKDFASIEDQTLALLDSVQLKCTYLDNDITSDFTDTDWLVVTDLFIDELKEREHQQEVRLDELRELRN